MTTEALNIALYNARYMTKGSEIRHYPIMFGEQSSEDIDELLAYIQKRKGWEAYPFSRDKKNSLVSILDDQIVITISNDAEAGLMQFAPGFRSGPSAGRGRGRGRGRGPGPGRSGGTEAEGLPAWHEKRSLYGIGLKRKDKDLGAIWENLLIPPPPGPSESLAEAARLLELQDRREQDAVRREEIVRQASFGISDYTAPLGIDSARGASKGHVPDQSDPRNHDGNRA